MFFHLFAKLRLLEESEKPSGTAFVVIKSVRRRTKIRSCDRKFLTTPRQRRNDETVRLIDTSIVLVRLYNVPLVSPPSLSDRRWEDGKIFIRVYTTKRRRLRRRVSRWRSGNEIARIS